MNVQEYRAAKRELPLRRKLLCGLSRRSPAYPKELAHYLNLVITVKGHAWSMDVKSERIKMAGLIAKTIKELSAV